MEFELREKSQADSISGRQHKLSNPQNLVGKIEIRAAQTLKPATGFDVVAACRLLLSPLQHSLPEH